MKTGACDRGRTIEAAAQIDVVGLPALAVLVAHGRALEADLADPVMRARVRAPVEVHTQPVGVLAEALLEQPHEPVHPRLRLGDREVAVRLAGAGDRIAAQRAGVERQADLREPRVDLVETVGCDVREDEVLLAREAHVSAEALGEVRERDHLVAAREAEVHRHADVVSPVGLRVDAEVVARGRQVRQLEALERAAEARLDTLRASRPGRCRRS